MIFMTANIDVQAEKTKKYIGYDRDEDYHIKPGSIVVIPKGTKLRSTHPQKDGEYEAKRTYPVTVNHIIPGQTYTFGVLVDAGTPEERVILNGIHWRDLYHKCQALGIDYPYGWDFDAAWLLEELKKTGRIELIKRSDRTTDIKFHANNPTVNWAGSGGYWVWADINDVTKVA